MEHFTIAIDGPGGAGKSTVAKNVAAKLNVLHLDTGAMYRAFAWQALSEGLSTRDAEALSALAGRITMDVRFEDGQQHTFVNGKDVNGLIRAPEISAAASDCATCGAVRSLMVRLQQQIAGTQSMILDGRDIGTRVLPDATLKVFLTASREVRAKRRCAELNAKGTACNYATVLADVTARDLQDSTREIDPLRAAPDAVTLDTSDMTQTEAEQAILQLLEQKMMDAKPTANQKKTVEKQTLLYKLARAVSFILFHTLMPVRYHHVERADQDAPFILIANHQNMADPLLIGWKCRRYQIRYLGKKELTKNPLLKAIYKRLLMIPVDRHNMDMAAVRACLKTLKENHVLGIFPEGTRRKTAAMENMESGVAMIALRGGVPILPAYVAGRPGLFRRVDCYYGEPFSVAEIAAKGVNRDTCEEVLALIRSIYQAMEEAHRAGK